MLGHLRPSTCSLDQHSKAAYQNFYCAICASLRKQHSLAYSLFINNELTLVLLAFEQDMQVQQGKTRCPSAGFTITRPAASSEAIAIAAQLSVLLGWVKVVDWNADKPARYKSLIQRTLQKKIDKIKPLISTEFQQLISDYIQVTKEDSTDFEHVNTLTGQLSEHVCLEIGAKTGALPEKSIQLAVLFRHCGELISIADHLIDLEADQIEKQYNPILEQSKQKNISISEAYYQLLGQFNVKTRQIQQLIRIYQQFKVLSNSSSAALQQSVSRIKQEVAQKRPSFIDTSALASDFVLAAAGCGPEFSGAECDCQQSSSFFDHQVSQCCCKGGGCPCDKCCQGCCKGGGGGCNCPCDNCHCGGGGCNCCKGGCDCPCDGCGNKCNCGSCGNSSGGCCNTGGNCNCCDCGDCCDCPSGNSNDNLYEYEETIKAIQEQDSLNQLRNIDMDVQLKESIAQIKNLSSEQIVELNTLIDSVAQADPNKLDRIKDTVDLLRSTAALDETVVNGEATYKMLKSSIVK